MRIVALDHLVLTVTSIETTCSFYARVLGLTIATFGEGRKALLFGSQKINLHEHGNELEPKASCPTPGSADLCLLTDTSLQAVTDHLDRQGVEIIEGPVTRSGGKGEMASVYFRDPDGNLIEVASYQDP
jgi:catechol 2,3-dioxygenase-like lactoylglutathione lyase family enzyme